MRYQSAVTTDLPQAALLTDLSPSEARIAGALARPRAVAMACLVALTVLGWLALGLMAATSGPWVALCRPAADAGLGAAALLLPMWAAMVLAMMLPTAGPMILTYAEIANTAVRKHEPVVSPLVLISGYVAVWLGFAIAAAAAQAALTRIVSFETGTTGAVLAGLILVTAGLYQFSFLKRACLAHCQRPFPFFFKNWTTAARGVFRLGLRQGTYCVGCCWAMMLVMLAVGAMNIVWMAALGVVMTIEKMTSGMRFSRAVGGGLIAAGIGMIAVTAL